VKTQKVKTVKPQTLNKSWFTRLLQDMGRDALLYILLIPFLAYYIIFIYKPIGGLAIAFQDYSTFKGIGGSEWVGFKHFISFFQGPYFMRTLRNTLLINFYGLLFSFPAPILLAILLNEVRQQKLKKTIQTMTYLPYFISTVVVVGIVTNLLSPGHGLITAISEMICGERIYFLTKPEYFRTIYTIMTIWQGIGYNSVIYIAALAGVDQELYEAAVIDGAGKMRQIWHITLPGILPTIMIMLILRIGSFMSVSTDSILLLYQPSTYETADVIGTYVYRTGIATDGGKANYSLSTAVGLFNSVVGLILVMGANYVSKKTTEEGIW